MNKRFKKRPEFLSLKTIVLLSLAISIGFQLIFILSFFFGESLISPSEKISRRSFHLDRTLLFSLMSFTLVFLLFLYNRRITRRQFQKKRNELLALIFGSLVITAVLSLTFSSLPALLIPNEVHPKFLLRVIKDGFVRDFSLMVIVILTTQLLQSLCDQHNIAVENEALRTENIRTRYEALKSQLDPHFLFNSLNTLKSLIDTDQEKAEEYIQQLSFVLRYTLQNKEIITLEEEMKCVQSYCNLMQIRYGNNLHFNFAIDEKYNSYKILPLSIQGLVENAIKHNTISGKQPLNISITATENAQVMVLNPIQPKHTEESGNRIGLANLSERYNLMWNKSIEIINNGCLFKVIVPLIIQET
jgi:Putative regulator of cell autolysis